MKAGFVTIVGKTNAGKSTLLNWILQKKVSITTRKPQTTRNAIQGIYQDDEAQIVFIDTPGIVKPHHSLDEYMDRQITFSLEGIDTILWIVDASLPFQKEDVAVMQSRLRETEVPLLIVFNKIDLTNVFLMTTLKKEYTAFFPKAELIEVSALKQFNVQELLQKIKLHLAEGEAMYPPDQISNHPITFLMSEIVREKMLLCLEEEVPHCCAVKTEKMERKADTTHILATIVVEKDSQKGIIIGKQGRMLKKIGTMARKEMEMILHRKVNLQLFVRVEVKWRESLRLLKELGYDE